MQMKMKWIWRALLALPLVSLLAYCAFDPMPFGLFHQNYVYRITIEAPDGRTMTNDVINSISVREGSAISGHTLAVGGEKEAVPFDLGNGRYVFVPQRTVDYPTFGPIPPLPPVNGVSPLVHDFDWAYPHPEKVRMVLADDITAPESFRWVGDEDGYKVTKVEFISTWGWPTHKIEKLLPWLEEYKSTTTAKPIFGDGYSENQKAILAL